MRKLISWGIMVVLLAFFGLSMHFAFAAGLTIPQGGTGNSAYTQGSVPIGPGPGSTGLRFATSSNFSFSTSTNIFSTAGILATASSTIGAGGQATGLTIFGGATSTGNLVVQGTGTSTFAGGVQGTVFNLTSTTASSTLANGIVLTGGCFQTLAGTCLAGGGSGTVTNIATTFPILGGPITNTGTLTFGGLSTSSPIAAGAAVLYATGVNTLASIATSTLSAGNGIIFGGTAGSLVGGTNLTIHGVGYAFTPSTNFAATQQATSSAIWGQAGLYASSTSVIGTTTFASNGYVGIGTSSPFAALTLDNGSGMASSSIVVKQYTVSTSTAKTIDCRDSNTLYFPIGASATTITLGPMVGGQTCKVMVVNPNASAGAITWAVSTGQVLYWVGGTAPSQTTTANKGDVWSFIAVQMSGSATSTPGTKIWGAQSANF